MIFIYLCVYSNSNQGVLLWYNGFYVSDFSFRRLVIGANGLPYSVAGSSVYNTGKPMAKSDILRRFI